MMIYHFRGAKVMFDIVFFLVVVVIAFLSCVALEIITYRVVASNKASREYCDKENVCDACGKNPKAENSQICKECQNKAYDD